MAKHSVKLIYYIPKKVATLIGCREIRDNLPNLTGEVCHEVKTKENLQRLHGKRFQNKTIATEDEGIQDIKSSDLWETQLS